MPDWSFSEFPSGSDATLFYSPTGFGDCSQNANPFAGTEPSGFFVFDTPLSGSWHDIGPLVRTKGMAALLLSPTYPFVRVLVVGGRCETQECLTHAR